MTRRQVDFFEMIYAVSFGYFIYFVLGYIQSMSEPVIAAEQIIYEGYVNKALLYTATGFSVLLVGYYGPFAFSLKRTLPRLRLATDPAQAHLALYLLYAFGTAIRLYLLSLGTHTWSTKLEEIAYGSSMNALASNLAYLNNLASTAYVLATVYFFSEGRTRVLGVVLWGVMLPLECLWGFLQASKSAFIPTAMAPFIAMNYLRRRATVGHVILPVLFVVFIVYPAVTEYRGWAVDYPIQLNTLAQDLPKIGRDLLTGVTTEESQTYVGGAPSMVIRRVDGTSTVSKVIQYVEGHGIIYGQTLWQLPLILIPTMFLPKKYEHLAYGSEFYGEVQGVYGTTSGIAIMQAGEFYLNFGLRGLLIGMFLQGILYRVWQIYWVQGDPLSIAFFILGWRILTLIEVPLSFAYGELIREVVFMIPIVWLMTRRASREPGPVSGRPPP
ncbi:MAG: hypothetical protein HYZ90_04995 [Candidatus Omnitrophica bacterium]|nr:hypothetical protein [Candidatus Omnitrophota bacterium]